MQLSKQILKFAVVGGTAFLIDFAVLWFFTEIIAFNYLLSNCLAFIISVIYNYIMSVKWVFNVNHSKNKWVELFKFILFSVIGLGINQLILCVGVEVLKANYLFSKGIASVVVMSYNFITRKAFLEKGLNKGENNK